METIETKPCRFKFVCALVFAQLLIIVLVTMMIGWRIYKTGNHLLITPDSISFGYFQELDESEEARKFAHAVERELSQSSKK